MRRVHWSIGLALAAAFFSQSTFAQTTQPLWQTGPADVVQLVGTGSETISIPGRVEYRAPLGPRGFFKQGFRLLHDSAFDWQKHYGLRFDVELGDDAPITLGVVLSSARTKGADRLTRGEITLKGTGVHTVTMPWTAFDVPVAERSLLKYVNGVAIEAAAKSTAGASTPVQIRNVRAVLAPSVGLQCPVQGKSGAAGEFVDYDVTVSNTTDKPAVIDLSLVKYGWETMAATVEPRQVELAPGQRQAVRVRVRVSDRVAPGGNEKQVVQAIANGQADRAEQLTLITVRQLPHPYILHTPARWQEVRDKVAKYDWAKQAQEKLVQQAAAWVVPEVAKPPKNDPDDTYGPYLFPTQTEKPLMACAITWQLTGDKSAAEKVATFCRRLSDPATGYPKTLRGCHQSQVQEGHFFQHIAMAYDMIRDANVFSDEDRRNIHATFRLFMTTIDRELDRGAINNWNLSESCGAFYCALAMQDLAAADRFFSGPSGIKEQLAIGTMDDGWWYECSISYNMWCASEFTQAALAYQAFGYDFLHERVPASYSNKVLLTTELNGGTPPEVGQDPAMRDRPFGMDATITGPNRRSYRTITDLWNSLVPFINYKGVMFGVNDSAENVVTGDRTEAGGQPFEIAYYTYRDPRYATLIKMGTGRDLLYGVPELPENPPDEFHQNASADNVGLVLLRSQTPGRSPREQIQAALHYGTHGWAHGHFDRTNLLSLMRYGKSAWNPESIWWGYEPFMYKFFVQTSVNHNMVVVDGKMQEATPGTRVLMHSGQAMQAAVVETTARWSHPPYGGMIYDYVPVKTFAEKMWREGRSVPEPTTKPSYGTLTEFTEPILQRRAMVVTDDYLVIADYVKAQKPHTFDNILLFRGFQGIDGAKPDAHTPQYDTDPRSSGQFITDCNWYTLQGTAKAMFKEVYGKGTDQAGNKTAGNDDGELNLGVYSVWPSDRKIMVGTSPEPHDSHKRLWYAVRGDGKTLGEGKFGSWLLGRDDVDVSVEGVKVLEFETKTQLAKRPTLFWLNARLITRDGREIPVSQLAAKMTNIQRAATPGVDYFGGPVKVQGELYKETLAAEPEKADVAGIIRIDVGDVGAVRLRTSIGGDYPLGDETQRRRTFAVRSTGTEARFLTVIEPFENPSVIQSVQADGENAVVVTLTDGRQQRVTIKNFDKDPASIVIDYAEQQGGRQLRSESTETAKN